MVPLLVMVGAPVVLAVPTAVPAVSLAASAPLPWTLSGGAMSIVKGLDGRLYIAEESPRGSPDSDAHVLVIDPDGARHADIDIGLSVRGDFGLAAGPGGVYWASNNNGSYGRIAYGAYQAKPVVSGVSYSNQGNAIVLGPDGGLWLMTNVGIARVNPATLAVTAKYPFTFPCWALSDTIGPDGALYFGCWNSASGAIGRFDLATHHQTHVTTTGAAGVGAIAAGPDGWLWYAQPDVNQIGRVRPNLTGLVHYTLAAGSGPGMLAAGPDGALYGTLYSAGRLVRVSFPSGVPSISYVASPVPGPSAIGRGPGDNLIVGQSSSSAATVLGLGIIAATEESSPMVTGSPMKPWTSLKQGGSTLDCGPAAVAMALDHYFSSEAKNYTIKNVKAWATKFGVGPSPWSDTMVETALYRLSAPSSSSGVSGAPRLSTIGANEVSSHWALTSAGHWRGLLEYLLSNHVPIITLFGSMSAINKAEGFAHWVDAVGYDTSSNTIWYADPFYGAVEATTFDKWGAAWGSTSSDVTNPFDWVAAWKP
jgi:virginiamycin B lyase